MVKVRLNRKGINPTARQCLLSLLRRDSKREQAFRRATDDPDSLLLHQGRGPNLRTTAQSGGAFSTTVNQGALREGPDPLPCRVNRYHFRIFPGFALRCRTVALLYLFIYLLALRCRTVVPIYYLLALRCITVADTF